MFPRYAALIAAGDGAGVRGLYHLTMQMVAVLTVPAAVVLFWFTGDLVQFWTGNRDVAAQAARVVPWLAAGLMFNALAVPPYTLQIAHGGTAAVLKINALLLAVFAPLLLVLARRFGAVGAAANFMAMQATLLLLMLPVTHVRLMRAEGWRAAAADLVPGAVVGVLAAVALPWLPWASWPLGVRVVVAVVTWVGLAGVLAVASARVREAWRTRWVALLGMWRA
jgi:O-antigen/teichoic acid export membrane protein